MADWEMRFDWRTWVVAVLVGVTLWLSGFLLVAGGTSLVEAGGGRVLGGIGLVLIIAVGISLTIAQWRLRREPSVPDLDPDQRAQAEAEAADARRRDTERGLGTTDVDE